MDLASAYTSKNLFCKTNIPKHQTEPIKLDELYTLKDILKTIKSIEQGSVTIIKQDNRIIQINYKQIMDLANFYYEGAENDRTQKWNT